jgi:hypothetical protein
LGVPIGQDWNDLSNFNASTVKAIVWSSTHLPVEVFVEPLALDRFGKPIVFWEQKVRPGEPMGVYYATDETDLVGAKYNGTSWVTNYISQDLNLPLRVRRGGFAVQNDADGKIHIWMPVGGQTYFKYKPIEDVDNVGVTKFGSGTNNYEYVDDGFTYCDGNLSYLRLSTTLPDKVSFKKTGSWDTAKSIISVRVKAVVKRKGDPSNRPAFFKFYLDSATGSEQDSPILSTTLASWSSYSSEWLTNPWTSASWTKSNIDSNLYFGIKSYGTADAIDITRLNLEIRYTLATDDEQFGAETWELISDSGLSWIKREVTRNSQWGVPIYSNEPYLIQNQMRPVWSAGSDIFVLADRDYGFMQPSGQDIKLYYGTAQIDRIADYLNLDSSTFQFKLQSTVNALKRSSTKDYYVYYGNKNSTSKPKSDPHNVYLLFEGWETLPKDSTAYGVEHTVNNWEANRDYYSNRLKYRIYSSPPEHSNKVYAGDRTLELQAPLHLATTFSQLYDNFYIDYAYWKEDSEATHKGLTLTLSSVFGSTSKSVSLGFYNNSTEVDPFYSYNERTTGTIQAPVTKYVDSSLSGLYTYVHPQVMHNFAAQVNNRGFSYWIDGNPIAIEVPSQLSKIRKIYFKSSVSSYLSPDYLDEIRIRYKLEKSTAYMFTSPNLTDAVMYYEADSTLPLHGYDAHHNFSSNLDQITSFYTRFYIQNSDATNYGPINHYFKLVPCTAQSYVNGIDRWTKRVTIQTNGASNSVSTAVSFYCTTLPGPRSFKINYYKATHNDGTSIDVATALGSFTSVISSACAYHIGVKDPIINVQPQQNRGFYFDYALQGIGGNIFQMDYLINGYINNKPLPISYTASDVKKSKVKISYTTQDYKQSKIKVSYSAQTVGISKVKVSYNSQTVGYSKFKISSTTQTIGYSKFKIASTTQTYSYSKVKISSSTQTTGISKIGLSYTATDYIKSKVKISYNAQTDIYSKIKISSTTQDYIKSKVLISYGAASVIPSKVKLSSTTQSILPSKIRMSSSTKTTGISKVRLSYGTQDYRYSKIKISYTGTDYIKSKVRISYGAAFSLLSKVRISYNAVSFNYAKIKLSYTTQDYLKSKVRLSYGANSVNQSKIKLSSTTQDYKQSKIRLSYGAAFSNLSKVRLSYGAVSYSYSKVKISTTTQDYSKSKIRISCTANAVFSSKVRLSYSSITNNYSKFRISYGATLSSLSKVRVSYSAASYNYSKIRISSTAQYYTQSKVKISYNAANAFSSKIKLSSTTTSNIYSKVKLSYTAAQVQASKVRLSFSSIDTKVSKVKLSYTSTTNQYSKFKISFNSANSTGSKVRISYSSKNVLLSKVRISYNSQLTIYSKIKLGYSAVSSNVSKIYLRYTAGFVPSEKSKIRLSFNAGAISTSKIKLSTTTSGYLNSKVRISYNSAFSLTSKIKISYTAKTTSISKFYVSFGAKNSYYSKVRLSYNSIVVYGLISKIHLSFTVQSGLCVSKLSLSFTSEDKQGKIVSHKSKDQIGQYDIHLKIKDHKPTKTFRTLSSSPSYGSQDGRSQADEFSIDWRSQSSTSLAVGTVYGMLFIKEHKSGTIRNKRNFPRITE